jgi:prophage antirepressor-like protein
MKTSIQIFKNSQFGEIRVTEIDGKTYFVGSDVAKALGYTNTSKALSDHCKGVTKRYIPTNGGMQEMNIIPEGDIYRLAAKSELPGAEAFESWIFDEVLPTIRKTGGYIAAKADETIKIKTAA